MNMAFVWKFPVTIVLVSLGVVLGLLVAFSWTSASKAVDENQVGYGYRVVCINEVLNGDAIIADLDLIKETDVYGPDIERLQLTVR